MKKVTVGTSSIHLNLTWQDFMCVCKERTVLGYKFFLSAFYFLFRVNAIELISSTRLLIFISLFQMKSLSPESPSLCVSVFDKVCKWTQGHHPDSRSGFSPAFFCNNKWKFHGEESCRLLWASNRDRATQVRAWSQDFSACQMWQLEKNIDFHRVF